MTPLNRLAVDVVVDPATLAARFALDFRGLSRTFRGPLTGIDAKAPISEKGKPPGQRWFP